MKHEASSARGISTRAVEIAVAVAIFALGAVVVFDSVRLGAKWGSDGPEAGYFPFYIGAIVCFCAGMLLLYAVVGKHSGPKVFVTWHALKQVLQVFVPALIYVVGIQLIGIYVASAVYIALFMIGLGHYRVVLSAAVGIGVMAAFFLMFEVWFKVPLYKGLYDPLAFLGY